MDDARLADLIREAVDKVGRYAEESGTRLVDPESEAGGPRPLDYTDREWPKLSVLSAVAALIEKCSQAEAQAHKEAFERAKVTKIPVIENIVRVGIAEGLTIRGRAGDFSAFIDDFIARLDRSLGASQQLNDHIAPLLGFDGPPGWSARFPNGVVLRELGTHEATRVLGSRSILSYLVRQASPFSSLKAIRWILQLESWDNPGEDAHMGAAFEGFTAILTAMRVYQGNQVGFPGIGTVHQPYGSASSGQPNPWFPPYLAWTPFEPPYELRLDQTSDLEGFVALTLPQVNPRSQRPLGLACSRVSELTGRTLDRDKILDASTALEAMLLPGKNDELRFRLALRGSLLLGDSAAERESVFATIYEGYDRRSRIVHGGNDRPERVTTKAYCEIARRVAKAGVMLSGRVHAGKLGGLLDDYAVVRADNQTFTEYLRTKGLVRE